MASLNGHCLCGSISYTGDADPVATIVCHCDDCQRSSGAAFSVNVLVPESELTINGEPGSFQTTGTDTQKPRERMFCKSCGSQLFTKLEEFEGMIVIKAGTLDDTDAFTPGAEIWTESKQAWVEAGAGGRQAAPRGMG